MFRFPCLGIRAFFISDAPRQYDERDVPQWTGCPRVVCTKRGEFFQFDGIIGSGEVLPAPECPGAHPLRIEWQLLSLVWIGVLTRLKSRGFHLPECHLRHDALAQRRVLLHGRDWPRGW